MGIHISKTYFKSLTTFEIIRMNIQIIAVTSLFLSAIYCQPANDANISQVLERFKGTWKEDVTKRQGLEEFLTAAGIDDKIKKLTVSTEWVGEKTISGKAGPNLPGIVDNSFSHHIVADNKTITEVDLKVMKEKGQFVVEVVGDSLVSHGINVPMICKRTVLPSNPNEMIQEVIHTEKQVTAKEVYTKV